MPAAEEKLTNRKEPKNTDSARRKPTNGRGDHILPTPLGVKTEETFAVAKNKVQSPRAGVGPKGSCIELEHNRN